MMYKTDVIVDASTWTDKLSRHRGGWGYGHLRGILRWSPYHTSKPRVSVKLPVKLIARGTPFDALKTRADTPALLTHGSIDSH